jgi:hypothetical protein
VVLAGNGATQRISGTGPEGRNADRAGANEKGRMSDQGGACGFALCNAISASLFASAEDLNEEPTNSTRPGKVFAFDGAGPADGSDNPAFHRLASKVGGEMYDSGALGGDSTVDAALISAEAFLAANPNGQIYSMGYSAGGFDAINFTNALADRGITVSGLVTFDPHRSGSIGLTTFHLAGNVGRSLNFYQQNSWHLLYNTFRGSPVSNWAMASNPNINLTGVAGVDHSGIVTYATQHHKAEIYGALGR